MTQGKAHIYLETHIIYNKVWDIDAPSQCRYRRYQPVLGTHFLNLFKHSIYCKIFCDVFKYCVESKNIYDNFS